MQLFKAILDCPHANDKVVAWFFRIHGCFAPPSSSPLTRIYTQMAERVGEEV